MVSLICELGIAAATLATVVARSVADDNDKSSTRSNYAFLALSMVSTLASFAVNMVGSSKILRWITRIARRADDPSGASLRRKLAPAQPCASPSARPSEAFSHQSLTSRLASAVSLPWRALRQSAVADVPHELLVGGTNSCSRRHGPSRVGCASARVELDNAAATGGGCSAHTCKAQIVAPLADSLDDSEFGIGTRGGTCLSVLGRRTVSGSGEVAACELIRSSNSGQDVTASGNSARRTC